VRTEVDTRLQQLEAWLTSLPGVNVTDIEPASADASFRRYFRVSLGSGATLVAMDAPPAHEDCGPFIAVTERLEAVGLRVPHIHAANSDAGFLLLDDLGTQAYLDKLNPETADELYSAAITALCQLQQADTTGLPVYDAALLNSELALFTDWFLGRHLSLILNDHHRQTLEAVYARLIDSALEQPSVFVHRDYHSRNLMTTEVGSPGIIDYQDAVSGPVTYDLVSLLRDCYIDWPEQRINAWVQQFVDAAVASGQLHHVTEETFQRWFDLMGIQRHLKAIGIFARLNHRDGKPGYLHDIPRTLRYVTTIAARYSHTAPLAELLTDLDVASRLTA